jgi:hypothetical protein
LEHLEGGNPMSQRLKKIALFGIILAALATLFYAIYKKFLNKTSDN